eukprot:3851022-Amphidinium_carterae.1
MERIAVHVRCSFRVNFSSLPIALMLVEVTPHSHRTILKKCEWKTAPARAGGTEDVNTAVFARDVAAYVEKRWDLISGD